MRARTSEQMAERPWVAEAASIVRSCVHCGFCNATCPTYQLTGDELEGPRGRIYLVKSLLEDGTVGEDTRRHLDQCLLCRNCETTCPSGVRYGRLVELARPAVNAAVPMAWQRRALRRALVAVVAYRRRLAPLVALGRLARPLLPRRLAETLPPRRAPLPAPTTRGARRVLALGGCAQPVLNPNIDAAAALVFERAGITLVRVPASGCCGALAAHLGFTDIAREHARTNLQAWWPHIEGGAEAVVATSSACALELKDYATKLAGDPTWGDRAERMQRLVRDPLELVDAAALAAHVRPTAIRRVAVQAPCTLQHGQRLGGHLERLLTALGFELVPVAEPHLCCGSAGSYSLLHRDAAHSLRMRKLDHLMQASPQAIVTANIGCQTHLGARAGVPVLHWLELLADSLVKAPG